MIYQRLFRLELLHEYHAHGVCSDFEIVPTAATATRLKQQRMRLRSFDHGLEVVAETTPANTLFIDLATGVQLEFLLKLSNNAFVQYTQQPTLPALSTEDQELGRKNWLLYSNETLAANEEALPQSEYIVEAENVLNYAGAWGVVRIALNSNITNNIGTPPRYTVSFSARSETWKYYLLTEPTAANYQVEDGLTEVTFSKTDMSAEASPDSISQRLIDQYPDATTYLFESSAPIAYAQLGRKHLNLRKDGALVIEHLPVPVNGQGGVRVVKTFV